MKSYGPEWKSSKLEVIVEGRKAEGSSWEKLDHFNLSGEHSITTSINYSHRNDLKDFLQPGGSTRVTFTVVGGTKFQINGLALCHSEQSFDAVE